MLVIAARPIGITTMGAKTSRERRVQIWFYRGADETDPTTQPANRNSCVTLRRHS